MSKTNAAVRRDTWKTGLTLIPCLKFFVFTLIYSFYQYPYDICRIVGPSSNKIAWDRVTTEFNRLVAEDVREVDNDLYFREKNALYNFVANKKAKTKRENVSLLLAGPVAVADDEYLPSSDIPVINASEGIALSTADPVETHVMTIPSTVDHQKEMRNGELSVDEKAFCQTWGKKQKESGRDVLKINLQRAYCQHFPGYNRHTDVLMNSWKNWYKNQKNANSVWYRSIKQTKN